jgi:hypothetical protein
MTQYTTYQQHWPSSTEFEQQNAVFSELQRHAVEDFTELLRMCKVWKGDKELVFTFDGDNWQVNSPFTLGIAYLIGQGCPVYAFKKDVPSSDKHATSWNNTPYTALVVLGRPPKEYTQTKCQAYVSYGLPRMLGIHQPQKDGEIVDGGGHYSDKFGRKMIDTKKPGLVQSSMVSEAATLDGRFVLSGDLFGGRARLWTWPR